ARRGPRRGVRHGPWRACGETRWRVRTCRKGRAACAGRPFRSSATAVGLGVRRGARRGSLDGDGRAGLLELRLGSLGVVLLDGLEDSLGGLVDERLGLLQTERGQAAHLLDDGDLRGAGGLEDDVELILLLLRLGLATGSGATGGGDGHGGGGGDVE